VTLDDDALLLRTEDVVRVLRIGRTKVVAMIGSGELPVVRIGRSVRVPRAALERWIASRTCEAWSDGEAA
jgi:excisionase family DNA binding protein